MINQPLKVTEMGHELRLDNLRPGQRALVKAIHTRNSTLRSKLLSMGIVAGTTIQVVCVAPLGGDPMEIKTRGYNLSLRLGEAHTIEIVRV